MKSATLLLPPVLLGLASCSTTNPPPTVSPAVAAVAPAAPSGPIFLGMGTFADAASGMVQVEAIDYTNRTCVLDRADGQTLVFKAGPEYVNFDQVKVGDSLMSTVTKTFVPYLVKDGGEPYSVTNAALETKPA